MTYDRKTAAIFLPNLLAFAALPADAYAHAGASIVLLLPTGYYMAGATITVASTFLLMTLLPRAAVARIYSGSARIATFPAPSPAYFSFLSFLLLIVLLSTGIWGSRDPAHNPLPAVIWTVWWVVITILHAFFGRIWTLLNPWSGPLAVLRWITGKAFGSEAFLPLPRKIGYGIAILQFFAFAWFELVDLAPADPERLAFAVAAYWLFNMLAMIVFGERDWTERGEPFSIFLRLIGSLAPLRWSRTQDGRAAVDAAWPGRFLIDLPPLPVSGVLFVLLTLSTVSFDGLSGTFLWLSLIGINPLDFPGRSAVQGTSTFGLLAAFAMLSAIFFACVAFGCKLAGSSAVREASGRLVYAIIPISVAFQIAHYLTVVLIELQNMLLGLTDPYNLDWDLIGTANYHTTTSFLYTFSGVQTIFTIQTLAVALGHVIAVVLAHALMLEVFRTKASTFRGELAFAILMIAYTALGLWLLSTPRI